MILEKLSQLATNLREHIAFIGLPIADILFLIILIIAKFIGDWRREVDVLGQLALDVKRLKLLFPWNFWTRFCLSLSLKWMQVCLAISINNNADHGTIATYRIEIANCLIDIAMFASQEEKQEKLQAAIDILTGEAYIVSLKSIGQDLLCRIYTKLALSNILKGNLDQAILSINSAFGFFYKPDGDNLAHPSHIAEAKIVWAMVAEKSGDYIEALDRLRQALEYAEKENLVLRVNQINQKIKEVKKLIL